MAKTSDILIAGGGIGGLTLALALHARGLGERVRLFEAAPVFREIGGGINLGPHAIKVFAELGLQPALEAAGILPLDYAFFTRFGQLVYREPWGLAAGHEWPHISIHRADLQAVLAAAVQGRLGADRVAMGHRCVGFSETGSGVVAHFADGRADAAGAVLVGCDGVHSAVRAQLVPGEGAPRFHGINLWRGVVAHAPILTGRSLVRIGAMHSTLIIYPIRDGVDEAGRQLLNWVAEVDAERAEVADWSRVGRLEDFLPVYRDWRFDWLDVPALLAATPEILAYPMVDRDPLARWTFGRVSLLGDAAHPMFPRGGNGGAQAILDARCLAQRFADMPDVEALAAYEAERLGATSKVVLQNRSAPPNLIVDTVEKRTGGAPFERLDDVVSQAELREIFASYQKTAGYHVDLVGRTKEVGHG